jgi:hypothetical protein
MREVIMMIDDIVDFDASSLEARFIVKRGVDEEVISTTKISQSVGQNA